MMPGVVLTSAAVCDRLDAAGLLRDDAGVVRVPVLVRGRLVVPEAGGVLEIREPTLDRATMRADRGATLRSVPACSAWSSAGAGVARRSPRQ